MPTILFINMTGEISGAERSLLSLLDALDSARWTAQVASPDGPLAVDVRERGIQHFALAPRALRRPHSPRQAWDLMIGMQRGRRQLLEVIRRADPAILHANTSSAMLCLPTAVHLPTIWQVRDLTPLGGLGAHLYRRADRVAVISSAVRADVLRFAGDGGEKIVLLPPAVNTKVFRATPDRAAVRAALQLPPALPLIGLLAQFVPWKRHHLFLDALALLPAIPWHAVLAGADFPADPSYLDALRARIAHSPFAERVTWLPWQREPEILLSALDICALTSQREPFGRVLIEAMACGVPVMAVDEGGVRDIVIPEQNGLLTPADPVAISAALCRLLENSALRHRFGLAGRAQVQATFSIDQQRLQLEALYTSLT
jgi:glycosyltransferase involved in cell wall biosynthesis